MSRLNQPVHLSTNLTFFRTALIILLLLSFQEPKNLIEKLIEKFKYRKNIQRVVGQHIYSEMRVTHNLIISAFCMQLQFALMQFPI